MSKMEQQDYQALLGVGFESFVFYLSNELAAFTKLKTKPSFGDSLMYAFASSISNIEAVKTQMAKLKSRDGRFSTPFIAALLMGIKNMFVSGKIKGMDVLLKSAIGGVPNGLLKMGMN